MEFASRCLDARSNRLLTIHQPIQPYSSGSYVLKAIRALSDRNHSTKTIQSKYFQTRFKIVSERDTQTTVKRVIVLITRARALRSFDENDIFALTWTQFYADFVRTSTRCVRWSENLT